MITIWTRLTAYRQHTSGPQHIAVSHPSRQSVPGNCPQLTNGVAITAIRLTLITQVLALIRVDACTTGTAHLVVRTFLRR